MASSAPIPLLLLLLLFAAGEWKDTPEEVSVALGDAGFGVGNPLRHDVAEHVVLLYVEAKAERRR